MKNQHPEAAEIIRSSPFSSDEDSSSSDEDSSKDLEDFSTTPIFVADIEMKHKKQKFEISISDADKTNWMISKFTHLKSNADKLIIDDEVE